MLDIFKQSSPNNSGFSILSQDLLSPEPLKINLEMPHQSNISSGIGLNNLFNSFGQSVINQNPISLNFPNSLPNFESFINK